MLLRTCSRSSRVPAKRGGTTTSPKKPSSVTSTYCTLGVNSEVTLERLTPEGKNTSSVTLRSVSRNSGL
ncbi:hypothetical protein D3C80_2170310 [compost metagenome]